jgi:hypothetical protein
MEAVSGEVGCWAVAAEEGAMDNLTLTMLSLTVFIVIFALVVDRLTREDSKHKGQSK